MIHICTGSYIYIYIGSKGEGKPLDHRMWTGEKPSEEVAAPLVGPRVRDGIPPLWAGLHTCR
jgi:hypothetical protein